MRARTFRRWTPPFEAEGEALRPLLGAGFWPGGSGGRRLRGETALSRTLRRLHGQAFFRASGARARVSLGLHLDQEALLQFNPHSVSSLGWRGHSRACRRPCGQRSCRLAEALNRLKVGPVVRGYEPFLIENGTPSFESRLMAVAVVRYGDRLKLEDDARRAVSRA
jgi:hypothetical protein